MDHLINPENKTECVCCGLDRGMFDLASCAEMLAIRRADEDRRWDMTMNRIDAIIVGGD